MVEPDKITLRKKDGTNIEVVKVHYRLLRLKRLRELGAPRWIIKYEQVLCLWNRRGKYREDLFKKYVEPLMGQGSVTILDKLWES